MTIITQEEDFVNYNVLNAYHLLRLTFLNLKMKKKMFTYCLHLKITVQLQLMILKKMLMLLTV